MPSTSCVPESLLYSSDSFFVVWFSLCNIISVSGTGGGNAELMFISICSNDPFCCGGDQQGIGFWDLLCVQQALNICQDMINQGQEEDPPFVSERRRILNQEMEKGYSRV